VILDYQMSTHATVEPLGQGLWRIITRNEDNLFCAEVTLDVKAPALDIRRAVMDVKRDDLGLVPDVSSASEKLVGVRVGPGMTKIVRGLIGGSTGSDRAAELVLEAMEMLVNSITVAELRKITEMAGVKVQLTGDGPKVYLNDRLIDEDMAVKMAANPRLKDSCVAFRDL
jgi:hypothetical protein